jgi:hypothetical protein
MKTVRLFQGNCLGTLITLSRLSFEPNPAVALREELLTKDKLSITHEATAICDHIFNLKRVFV